MSVSVKGVVIEDMKTFLAKKKQERDQRSKLVKEPYKAEHKNLRRRGSNQHSKSEIPGNEDPKLNKNARGINQGAYLGRSGETGGRTPSEGVVEKWEKDA